MTYTAVNNIIHQHSNRHLHCTAFNLYVLKYFRMTYHILGMTLLINWRILRFRLISQTRNPKESELLYQISITDDLKWGNLKRYCYARILFAAGVLKGRGVYLSVEERGGEASGVIFHFCSLQYCTFINYCEHMNPTPPPFFYANRYMHCICFKISS